MLIFDYSKLVGRIREMGFTQDSLAEVVGIGASTLNLKLCNKRLFKQDEILKIVEALKISIADIPMYFFCLKTSENGS